MSAISTVITEKKAELKQLNTRREALLKQISDLEKEAKAAKPAIAKPATKKPTATGRKTGGKK